MQFNVFQFLKCINATCSLSKACGRGVFFVVRTFSTLSTIPLMYIGSRCVLYQPSWDTIKVCNSFSCFFLYRISIVVNMIVISVSFSYGMQQCTCCGCKVCFVCFVMRDVCLCFWVIHSVKDLKTFEKDVKAVKPHLNLLWENYQSTQLHQPASVNHKPTLLLNNSCRKID